MDPQQALTELLNADDPRLQVWDGVGHAPQRRYWRIYGGIAQPDWRPLAGATDRRRTVWSILAVNNTANGARIVADRAVQAVDGKRIGDCMFFVIDVSSPVEDRDDPSDFRWSATVTVELHH